MQEKCITELRSFIEVYMRPMMELVSQQQEGICQRYQEEFGRVVPEDIMEDEFSLFDLYKSHVSKQPDTSELDKIRDENKELKLKVEVKDNEVKAILLAQTMLLGEAKNMEA